MAHKQTPKLYKGKHSHMCAAIHLAWNNYLAHLADFQKKNIRYTKQLVTDQLAAIEAAQEIPQVVQRRAIPKEARIVLHNAALDYAAQWQTLSSLIENAFTVESWEGKKSAAGSTYYRKATHRQWSSVTDLIGAAADFVEENEDALLASGMLPGFPQQLGEVAGAYIKLYDSFYKVKQNSRDETKEFIAAGNAVYKVAAAMMRTACRMYRNNSVLCQKFTYASLITIVRGKGFTKTGCRFIVKEGNTGEPVYHASIIISGEDVIREKSFGDKDSVFIPLPAGSYSFTLTAPNLTTHTGTIKVNEGKTHQKTVRLISGASGNTAQQGQAI